MQLGRVREGRVDKSTKKSTNIQKEKRRSCSLIDSFLSSNGTALSHFHKGSKYSKFKKPMIAATMAVTAAAAGCFFNSFEMPHMFESQMDSVLHIVQSQVQNFLNNF